MTCPDFWSINAGNAVQHALDVDVDRLVPVVGLQLGERRVRHDAGVQKDDVDAPELVLGELDDRLVGGWVGHV